MTRTIAVAGIAASFLAFAPRAARAYPNFQISSGAPRCSSCHFAPDGGGLLNGFGRYESAYLSARNWPWWSWTPPERDVEPVHGAVRMPGWLDVGGELRVAGLVNHDAGSETYEWLVIPMQVDLLARVQAGKFAATGTVGLRGAARPDHQPLSSYFVSREHYALWQRQGEGFYARAGRFLPTFGLRLVDHTAYVRQYQGLDLLEESYGAGAGYVVDRWEAHVNAFLINPLKDPSVDERGGTLYAEARAGLTAWGVSVRAATAQAERRLTAGFTGKVSLARGRLMLLAEVDGTAQAIQQIPARYQVASYFAGVYSPWRGLYVTASHEFYSEDLAFTAVARTALGLSVSYLPRSHWELFASARYQLIGGADRAFLGMLMLHYYL